MIALRVRQPGESEWTVISVESFGEDGDFEGRVASIVTSCLVGIPGRGIEEGPLRVQTLNEEGQWEDVE